MTISRFTRRAVRYWVPRFRSSDIAALRAYNRYAWNLYSHREARIIERVTLSEQRRRARTESTGREHDVG